MKWSKYKTPLPNQTQFLPPVVLSLAVRIHCVKDPVKDVCAMMSRTYKTK